MNYRIQNLLHRDKDGAIRGAMSPVLFIDEMAKQIGFIPHGICRVWFEDENIHNKIESSYSVRNGVQVQQESVTGFDTLIVCQHHNEQQQEVMMFVDEGVNGCPVAMSFTDEEEVTITPIYEKRTYIKKLTQQEIKAIFTDAIANNYFQLKKLYPKP